MVLDQQISVRKPSGGRFKKQYAKKKHAMGRTPTLPRVGEDFAQKDDRARGGQRKVRVLRTNMANLYDPKAKKFLKAKIEMVTENPGNRHYVRRNVLTKGAIIKTDKGMAKVTSRPGQEAQVNAVLI